jgi:hypothetical protein
MPAPAVAVGAGGGWVPAGAAGVADVEQPVANSPAAKALAIRGRMGGLTIGAPQRWG